VNRRKFLEFSEENPTCYLAELNMAYSDLMSFSQLVQEMIGGAVGRHTFSEWELELLLDLQSCRIRKSARPNLLRHYLKAVHQGFAEGASSPLRLASFVERHRRRRMSPARTHAAPVS
jgi:hypothetical protein